MIQAMRNCVRGPARLLFLLVVLSLACFGQSAENNWGDNLVKWKTDCYPKGCLMQTDVLRGESGNPPDPSDFREYIGIDVGLSRKTQKPIYFAFHVDPNAQQDQGVFVAFTKTTKDGNSWKINIDKDGASRLSFERCNDKSCMARVPLGLVKEGTDSHNMDLLEKFLNSDHLLVLYMKGGHPYRTMVLLSSFKKEYQHVLATELNTPSGN